MQSGGPTPCDAGPRSVLMGSVCMCVLSVPQSRPSDMLRSPPGSFEEPPVGGAFWNSMEMRPLACKTDLAQKAPWRPPYGIRGAARSSETICNPCGPGACKMNGNPKKCRWIQRTRDALTKGFSSQEPPTYPPTHPNSSRLPPQRYKEKPLSGP